ncbi:MULTISPECIES: type I DNA topoisomerase [unclassified Thioalkalivibrio]|uniref:type I DNA topoisomerase n=1 Tax=unclassified Thioalkalivibrio TaxID=2621013 RepID=UPI00037578B5|nr:MULTISPECIES: type I DNA topoisomerase [unclassified Thioalkalivibrio]
MNLLIVESPSKCKTIEGYLGPGWVVAASYGHIRDLPEKEIGVAPPDFRPKYEIPDRSKKAVSKLRSLAKKADKIFLATDPDREGEAISWHLAAVLGVSKDPRVSRISFNSITPEAVKSAVSNPGRIDTHLVAAQECRRVLDRLIGYMVSPDLARALAAKASAGRVQTPALRLVVDRQNEIDAFVPTDHFLARLGFPGGWSATWVAADHCEGDPPYCLERGLAEQAAGTPQVRVATYEEGTQSRNPSPAFTTSSLQQAASSKLKIPPKRAMDLAQKLYEKGLISYHRTDSKNLSDESVQALRAYLSSKGIELPEKPNRWKEASGSQEAHESIHPTRYELEKIPDCDDPDLQRLYDLIHARARASQMLPARYNAKVAILESTQADSGGRIHRFRAKGRVLKSPGWLAAWNPDEEAEEEVDPDDDPDADNPIPRLANGSVISVEQGQVVSKTTKAPPLYTEASLVRALERRNIGRPSTYASILDLNQRRGYWSVSKGKIHPEPIGHSIINALRPHFQFVDLAFTADLEAQLDRVAKGEAQFGPLVKLAYEMLSKETENLRASNPEAPKGAGNEEAHADCPKCGRAMRRLPSKKKSGSFWWSCSGFREDPKCDFKAPDLKGAKPPKPDLEAASNSERSTSDTSAAPPCPNCNEDHGGLLLQRKGKYGVFYGCNRYPECKTTVQADKKTGEPALESA